MAVAEDRPRPQRRRPTSSGASGSLKGAVLGVWEVPTAGTMRQVENARREMQGAIVEAQGIMAKARAMSQTLSANGITMKLPD